MKYIKIKSPNMLWYISGYFTENPRIRLFTALCAFASYVPDEGLLVLATDDRTLLHMDDFIDSMKSEIFFVDDLSDYTWQQVSCAVGQEQNPSLVRSHVVRAALVSYAFAYQRIVCFYKREPWSFTQGGPDENIEELAARTEA